MIDLFHILPYSVGTLSATYVQLVFKLTNPLKSTKKHLDNNYEVAWYFKDNDNSSQKFIRKKYLGAVSDSSHSEFQPKTENRSFKVPPEKWHFLNLEMTDQVTQSGVCQMRNVIEQHSPVNDQVFELCCHAT